MFKKLFLSLPSILILFFLFANNSAYSDHAHCKVSFCSCCTLAGNGAQYDIYNAENGFYEGGFTLDSLGDCTPGLNLWNDSTYYVTTSCHRTTLGRIIYFTPCVCRGTDTVHVPCCPQLDNPSLQIESTNNSAPSKYSLHQNYPNPFNPSTKIEFDTPVEGSVKLSVYDISGKEIEVLLHGNVKAGFHEIVWNSMNVSSGVYFYKIETPTFTDMKKMVVIK